MKKIKIFKKKYKNLFPAFELTGFHLTNQPIKLQKYRYLHQKRNKKIPYFWLMAVGAVTIGGMAVWWLSSTNSFAEKSVIEKEDDFFIQHVEFSEKIQTGLYPNVLVDLEALIVLAMLADQEPYILAVTQSFAEIIKRFDINELLKIRSVNTSSEKDKTTIKNYYLQIATTTKPSQVAEHLWFKIQTFCWQRLLQIDPNEVPQIHAKYWGNLAALLQINGHLEEALDCYDQALLLDPENLPALSNKMTIHLQLNQVAEVKKTYQQFPPVSTIENAEVLFNMGNISANLGNTQEAQQNYKTALEKDPEHVAALNNLALLYVQQNQQELAVPLLFNARKILAQKQTEKIAENQNQLSVHHNFIALYSQYLKQPVNTLQSEVLEDFNEKNNLQDALESIEILLLHANKSQSAYFPIYYQLQGAILLQLGDFSGALKAFGDVSHFALTNEMRLHNVQAKAWTYFLLGHEMEAMRNLDIGRQAFTDHVFVSQLCWMQGYICEEQAIKKDQDEQLGPALNYYKTALEFHPDNEKALKGLKRCQQLISQKQKKSTDSHDERGVNFFDVKKHFLPAEKILPLLHVGNVATEQHLKLPKKLNDTDFGPLAMMEDYWRNVFPEELAKEQGLEWIWDQHRNYLEKRPMVSLEQLSFSINEAIKKINILNDDDPVFIRDCSMPYIEKLLCLRKPWHERMGFHHELNQFFQAKNIEGKLNVKTKSKNAYFDLGTEFPQVVLAMQVKHLFFTLVEMNLSSSRIPIELNQLAHKEKLLRELQISLEMYYTYLDTVVIHWYKNIPSQKRQELCNALADNMQQKILALKNFEEYVYPSGWFADKEPHILYISFLRENNYLYVRIDNLGAGAFEHHLINQEQGEKKIYPQIVAKMPFDEEIGKKVKNYLLPLIENVMIANSKKMKELIYPKTFGVDKETQTFIKKWKPKKPQITFNCPKKGLVLGAQYRLLGKEQETIQKTGERFKKKYSLFHMFCEREKMWTLVHCDHKVIHAPSVNFQASNPEITINKI